ncbi:DUF99 family protein [Haloarculaceae archaeon H-GB2-1]|nr:DUF99 family protein [Haloarculaceae archaeon H-GB1-1]MEA5389084.1 DUF99 family protein [Haloarculaceae archaeon H-GB11]MEA5407146.1 DUF99 family protein [Haloarculaceae archaeon H-GB2-1]
MKAGVRALGIAESFTDDRSTLAGAVVRADRVVDGFAFGRCTVGGHDATDAVCDVITRLDRPDVRYVLVAGIAPAWFNILDLRALYDAVERPVISITFEESPGLESAIESAFDGQELTRRLARYHAQPDRWKLDVDDETLFVRNVGCTESEAADVVRAFTPEGGRPEPLRVARLAARGVESAFGADADPPSEPATED